MEWYARFEDGQADTDSHPAYGGNPGWNQLGERLKQGREVPAHARRALAQIEWLDKKTRYGPEGPEYQLRWRIL